MNKPDEMESDGYTHKPHINYLWFAIALALIAVVLLLTSFTIPGKSTAPQSVVTQPSPTWAAFPTRLIVEPALLTPSPEAMALYDLKVALLAGEPNSAELHWVERIRLGDLTAEDWFYGAALALQQEDLETAAYRTLKAIESRNDKSEYWYALGYIYRQQGFSAAATQCFEIAESLNPDRAVMQLEHFDEFWETALQSQDDERLVELALLHTQEQPDSPLNPYYAGKALLSTREYTDTISLLIDAITATQETPAIVWYTLGEAYFGAGGYREASKAFEVAASQHAAGDTSLTIGLLDPLRELNWLLAQSYYFSERCAEAESVFQRWADDESGDSQAWIDKAIVCQTPTPTPTPWILSQQSTPTPQP